MKNRVGRARKHTKRLARKHTRGLARKRTGALVHRVCICQNINGRSVDEGAYVCG
jgi:hypothetical protein